MAVFILTSGSIRPGDPAVICADDDENAESNAIPGKHREIVVADVTQQPAHAQEGGDEGGNAADAEHGQVGGREQGAFLVERVQPGGEQGGHREKEREFGCRLARHAEEKSADDGGARAAGAGNEGKRLGASDLERIHHRHLIDRVDAIGNMGLVMPALYHQNDDPADDKGQRDRNGREQVALDGLGKQQPEHCSGDEGDNQIEGEFLCGPFCCQPFDHGPDLFPIFPDDGQHGAGLDGDVEDFLFFAIKFQQTARKNEVAR